MTSKKHGCLLMKIYVTVKAIIFPNETNLCLPLLKRFQKTFAHKVNINNFSEYIFKQLK